MTHASEMASLDGNVKDAESAPDREVGDWRSQPYEVKDFLAMIGTLGVPTFQRGAVWSSEDKGKLLESLSRHYFAGTILLWEPPVGAGDTGAVCLIRSGAPKVLLIDGQQRARALYELLAEPVRVKDLELEVFGKCERDVVEGALWSFVRKRNGELTIRKVAHGGNLSPADWIPVALLTAESTGRPLQYHYTTRLPKAKEPQHHLVAFSLTEWKERFHSNLELLADAEGAYQEVLSAAIDVRVLAGHEWTLERVVDNYRALNSGGSPLREEEVEFAFLVKHLDNANEILVDIMKLRVGGEGDSSSDEDAGETDDENSQSKREWLDRGDEREFGLKLFVRAVRLARDDSHGRAAESKRWLTMDVPPEADAARQVVQLWAANARAAVIALARAIQSHGCDYRPTIPKNSAAFGGLLWLLVRFPALAEDSTWANAQVKMLALGQFLADDTADSTVMRLAATSVSASDAVDRYRKLLCETFTGRSIADRVKRAKTLQSPMVSLFYWWLRSKEAGDIHPRLPPRRLDRLGPKEEQGPPQRQHILPFKGVKFEAQPEPSRAGAHAVNSLGNLTWISTAANQGTKHGCRGWWATPMEVQSVDPQVSKHVLEAYLAITKTKGRPWEDKPFSVQDLDALVAARSGSIAELFGEWWRDSLAMADDVAVPDDLQLLLPAQSSRHENSPDYLRMFARWGCPGELARSMSKVMYSGWVVTDKAKTWKLPQAETRFCQEGIRDPTRLALQVRGPNDIADGCLKCHLEFRSDGHMSIPLLNSAGQIDGQAVFDWKTQSEDAIRVLRNLTPQTFVEK